MATNFTISGDMKSKKTPTGHYEPEKQHKSEMKRIVAVEKELKKHEKMPAAKAHGKWSGHCPFDFKLLMVFW